MARLASLVIVLVLAALSALVVVRPADAQKVPDVKNTKHNLSASGPGPVKATTETQICVFCHTPHGAQLDPNIKSPLWNRKFSGATYTSDVYGSSSMEADAAELAAGPGGTSRMCLSCHDGTMALSSVNVLNGKANQTIALTGAGTGDTMPVGEGPTTGFTRHLGVNFTNDHPISFTYDAALAGRDGELRTPDGTNVGNRGPGVRPRLPLENGQVQCSTCHDPHLKEQNIAANGPAKFLRLNRIQQVAPTGGAFTPANDIFCLACHDKAGQAWALSAHANPSVADELYNTTTSANLREFPTQLPVWKAACLNCHDTHTVQGARRLLREGTDGIKNAAGAKAGGASAIEETCYQCHAASGESILTNVTGVPDIKTDFGLAIHMPIKSSDQRALAERHDIGTGAGTQRGKDFVESPALLGKGDLTNRHVECTDCHNPHRVIRNRLFNAANPAVPDTAGTHNHTAGHTNIASGVLRGTTGVEPTAWSGVPFGSPATTFDYKRGDGGASASNAVGSAWVTREYQVCLKCHSTYAYDSPPLLSNSAGGATPAASANGLTQFTDQAMEFQAPHPGTTSRTDSGAYSGSRPGCATANVSECNTGTCRCYAVNYQSGNWRSWHPVIAATGRTAALRSTGATAWKWPWNNDVGTQTMYCSDCHGSSTIANTVDPNCTVAITNTTVNPNCGDNGKAWGPHGSTNPFILKGGWSNATTASSANALCIKCHSPTSSSGFSGGGRGNLHAYHDGKISGGIRCTWCHIAVPHGWKNRAFLVNLNDVGPEAGLPAGTQVRNGVRAGYNNPPYYLNAVLKIRSFGTAGSWTEGNCGSAGSPGNGETGRNWMRDSTENCATAP